MWHFKWRVKTCQSQGDNLHQKRIIIACNNNKQIFPLLTVLVWSLRQTISTVFLQWQPPAEGRTPSGSWLGSCWAPHPTHTHTHDSSRPVFSVDIILLDTDSGNVTGSKQIPTCKHIFIRVSQSFISIMTSFSFDEVSLPVRNKLFPKYVHLRVHLYLSGH